MDYTNHSPDTLTYIWFHLWPNAYKNNKTALVRQLVRNKETWAFFSIADDRGYMDSLDFSVNGERASFVADSVYIDIGKLLLNQPLLPGQAIRIATPFYVKIPSAKISRLGHDKNQYYITQWYPKPAVYDRYGWHPMPYLDQGEFYSEFGDYEVAITLPETYVVGATGELQDVSEKTWLMKRTEYSEKLMLEDPKKIEWNYPETAKTKTITYKAENVHDFAWFADREVLTTHKTTRLPSGKEVDVWAFYKWKNRYAWQNATQYIEQTLQFYSEQVGEYPYPVCMAYDGDRAHGGGMEYPMITLIDRNRSDYGLENVIVHEVGHNWFFGILANNERDHAWMDEGINSFYERKYFDTYYPGEKLWMYPDFLGINQLPERTLNYYSYLYTAREHTDQQPETPSADLTEENYGAIIYSKTAEAMYYLEAWLGDSTFKKCMQQYYREWKFRHPYPDDMEKVFDASTEKNTGWWWSDMIYSTKKIDYKVTALRRENDSLYLTIKNLGTSDAPFPITDLISDSSAPVLKWSEGFFGQQEIIIPATPSVSAGIDGNQLMPDVNRKNNFIKKQGNFKRMEKIRLQFFTSIENPYRTQIFFFPTLGWNDYNKFMAGIAVYNKSLIPKKLEFVLNPMLATQTLSFVGNADVSYTHYPKKGKLQKWNIHLPFSRFGYYTDSINSLHYIRLAPELTLEFKKRKPTGLCTHSIHISTNFVFRELPDFIAYNQKNGTRMINKLSYQFNVDHALRPVKITATLEHINEFGLNYTNSTQTPGSRFKLYLEAWTKLIYFRKNKGFSVRLFAGTFLDKNYSAGDFRFRLSAPAGYQDYGFDQYFIGRSETDRIWSQQMMHGDGDFKAFSFVGQTDRWLVAVNLKADIPVLPLSLYMDFGTYAGAGSAFSGSQAFVYNGGICIEALPGILEIYLPLFMSSDINNAINLNTDNYWQRIRFMINLKNLDPFTHGRAYFR